VKLPIAERQEVIVRQTQLDASCCPQVLDDLLVT
jgi:hypothetical protein